jgi:cell division protein FtsW
VNLRLRGAPDLIILTATLLLVAFGLTMMLCASEDCWTRPDGQPGERCATDSALGRQFERALIGLAGLALALAMRPAWIHRLAPFALLATLMLVALTLTPLGRGPDGHATSRWLSFFEMTLQPSEMLKLALVVHLARLLARKGATVASWSGLAPPIVLVVGVAALVAAEPSMGVALSIVLIGLGIIFAAGARLGHLVALGGVAVSALVVRLWTVPYGWKRLLDFMAGPTSDRLGDGYQLDQSLIALGSGGWIGKGFGESMQKFQFLPASHTDFVFSIIGEEGGFVVAVLVLGIYALIVARALWLSMVLGDPFRSLLAAGVAMMISVQVILNVAVVTGLMPTTGLPLPFLSYGGSSLVVHLAAVGILLRVSADAPAGVTQRTAIATGGSAAGRGTLGAPTGMPRAVRDMVPVATAKAVRA